jgi:hypothetical protein
MGPVLSGWLSTLTWSNVTYGACMLFDMGMNYRVRLSYIVPEGTPTVERKFWTGFSPRHLVLVPIAFLIVYGGRNHTTELSPALIWFLGFSVLYLACFFRDFFKELRSSARSRYHETDL